MPVRCSSSTSVRWLMVPGPDEATFSVPGLALASAMKARRSDAGRSGRATSTCGAITSTATGANCFSGSLSRLG